MEGITVSEVILDVDRSAVTINGLRMKEPKFYKEQEHRQRQRRQPSHKT